MVNETDNIIIVADLGHFKAFKVTTDPEGVESPRVALLKSYDSTEARLKASEKFSDSAGRFKRDGNNSLKSTASYGERHNIQNEAKKRLISMTAKSINELIMEQKCERWHLAATKSMNNTLLGMLDPGVREKLGKNLKSDLTNTAKSKILGYFE